MIIKTTQRLRKRKGSVLPLTVISLVGMCGFVALSVDIGMIAVAKTQCQNAADAAAMAGARGLTDGATGQNLGAVGTTGSALDNAILRDCPGQPRASGATWYRANVTLTAGSFHYNTTSMLFHAGVPSGWRLTDAPEDNYNLMQVSVSYNVNTAFAPAFNAHRPGVSIPSST